MQLSAICNHLDKIEVRSAKKTSDITKITNKYSVRNASLSKSPVTFVRHEKVAETNGVD